MRPLCLCAAGVLLGVLLSEAFSDARAYLASLVIALVALMAALMKKRGFWILFVCMAFGLCRAAASSLAPAPTGEFLVSGRVCEEPAAAKNGVMLLLDDVLLNDTHIRGRLRLYAPYGSAPQYGQAISLRASVRPPETEQRSYDRYRFVVGTAYAKGGVSLLGEREDDFYGGLLRLRARIGAQIDLLFPNGDGAASGMLLGEKSRLDADTRTAFRTAGISHLLAVSGLHVSVLAGAFSLLFRRNAWVRFFATAFFLLLYAAVTAFAPSVLRAGVMLLYALLAFPLRRRRDPFSALSAAFVLIVLCRPFALFYVGFQLSFSAVYALILLAPILQRPLSRLGSAASGLIASSTAATLGTLPASSAFFGETQALSVVTNLFVLPIVPVFLIPAFFGTALSFLSFPLGNAVCLPARAALALILAVARYGGQGALHLSAPSITAYLCYLLAMLPVSRLCMRPKATRALYGMLCLGLAALFW